nr:carboxypeptidase regulatory-like domain-containing protein [Blautia sp. MSJ-19]
MEKGATYTLTVKKDGYNDYKETNFTFNPTELNTVKTVTLKKIVTRNIKFNVTDKSGNPIDGATVTVKKGYYDKVQPEADGSYNLIDGTTYNYTVEAKNYKSILNQSFTPDKDGSIDVQLEKNISAYTVTINPVDSEEKAIENASVKVTYEEEDPWDEDETETVELKANEDGTYTMQKGVTYTYTVTAPDYKDVTDTYTPSGDDENVSFNVKMVSSIDPADVETVNAIKEKFDAEMGALRPNFATDKNILDLVNRKIAGYTDIDTTGVTVSVKSSDDTDWVAADGTIHYRAQSPDQWGNNLKNVSLVYVFEKNGAKAETESRVATICWDRDYFNTQMEADKDNLTWDKIKGSNTDVAGVTSDLTLPQCLNTSAKMAWSKITWTSSNEDVISFKDTGYGSLIDAKTGVVTQPKEDTEVTLTATFNANDTLLNSYVEKVSDFATLTKEFKVTVKGTGETGPTEEDLLSILDQYYTADQIKNFGTDETADLENCTSDLQLLRYTRIKDAEGNYVFANKEITVTSDNDAITINGYRAAVDRFASEEDVQANLIITFTRDGVTATKKIPVTVKAITEAEVQDQLDLMEYAKEHYFDGINDGQYADKDSITGDLHAFQELTADKTWIYNNDDKTGKGIVPDEFPEYDAMASSYRLFKSSNNAVVQHENLVVTRRETDTQITISSVLSSELYKDAAAKHPENTVLQKLYKQPVSVTVTIKGTKTATEGLQQVIDEAQTLLDEMTEGTEAGQYPEGTKATLQTAIDAAKEVLAKEDATEKEVNDATLALQDAIAAAKEAQNVAVSDVKVRVNMAGKQAELHAFSVTSKDAAAYGYEKPDAMKNQVTVADALYVLHKEMYGEAFDADPSKYLVVGTNGYISTIFEDTTGYVGYYVNNKFPQDETGNGSLANTTVLKTGDELSIFMYADTTNWSDKFLYFEDVPTEHCVGEIPVTVKSVPMMSSDAAEEADCTVELKNLETEETAEFVTDEKGVADVTVDKAGKYQITVTKTPYDYIVAPTAEIEVKEHVFDEGVVTKEAAVGEAGEMTYTCTVCGATKTEEIPEKNFYGEGTKEDPYQLATADDLVKLKNIVKEGTSTECSEGTCFIIMNDITLPDGWTPIGETIDGSNNIQSGKNLHAFSGIIDGNNKTITVPEGGLPLLGYIKNAEVHDLNIYGTRIAGYGLVNNYEGVGLSGNAITLDNITLKSGTSTLKSGLLGANKTTNGYAGASAGFVATIRNCTVEAGVVIGYDREQSVIGSFAGRFNGTITNCVSNATVYGKDFVGGILAGKDNSMSGCTTTGCTFGGTVVASGKNAGGIAGGDYIDIGLAPNAIRMNISNCTATGTIIGADNVGGIMGGDPTVIQSYANGNHSIKDNFFAGKVSATEGTYVGGIIGYYRGLNRYDDIAGNTYTANCGAEHGIGHVEFVDTSSETHETEIGENYINTANGTSGLPSVPDAWFRWRANLNRTDDPLGADADNLAKKLGEEQKSLSVSISADKESAMLNDTVEITAAAEGGSGEYTYRFVVSDANGNEYVLSKGYTKDNKVTWTAGVAGTKTLYVDVKDSEGAERRATLEGFEVKVAETDLKAELTADPSTDVTVNDKVKLTAAAEGGAGDYEYRFMVSDNKGNWYIIRDFAAENTCEWDASVAGKKTLYVDVRDGNGTVKRASLSFEVAYTEMNVGLKVSKGSLTDDKLLTLTATAANGVGTYSYRFTVSDEFGNEYVLQNYSTKATCNWYANVAGKKTLSVDVKDSTGAVKTVKIGYTVKETATDLTAKMTVDPVDSILSGEQAVITVDAEGGSGAYMYKFLVCDNNGNWYVLRNYGIGNTCVWNTTVAGKKTLYVDVKDSSTGVVKRVAASYEVKEK